MVDLCATKAAKRAGYSQKTAYAQGHALLKKPEIQAVIERLSMKRQKRTELTQDMVIEQLRRCERQSVKAKQFSAAIRANELLGKHLGMFEERHTHQVFTYTDFVEQVKNDRFNRTDASTTSRN